MIIKACYCKPGPMSQCVAQDFSDQMSCIGFTESTVAIRCMHINTNLDNHCDNIDAQRIGLRDAEITFGEDTSGEIIPSTEEEYDIRSCTECKRVTCSYLLKEKRAAKPSGGLTADDLVDIASNCHGFEYREDFI